MSKKFLMRFCFLTVLLAVISVGYFSFSSVSHAIVSCGQDCIPSSTNGSETNQCTYGQSQGSWTQNCSGGGHQTCTATCGQVNHTYCQSVTPYSCQNPYNQTITASHLTTNQTITDWEASCTSCSGATLTGPCTSSANTCGMTNSGTYQTDGTCSGTTPDNSLCPPVDQCLTHWKYCAVEGGTCSFSGPATNVRFGQPDPDFGSIVDSTRQGAGLFDYEQGISGSISCDIDSFGGTDPDYGIQKQCQYCVQPVATPTNFTATPQACGTGQIKLAWDAVFGATHYTITDTTTGWSSIVYTTSDVITGLPAGSDHTYSVTASNDYDTPSAPALTTPTDTTAPNSCPSGQIFVTLTATPAGPLTAPGATNLSWTTTGNPDSCDASNYWSGTNIHNGDPVAQRSGMTAGTYIFDITCHKSGVTDATSEARVVVNNPAVTVTSVTASCPASLTAQQTGQCTATVHYSDGSSDSNVKWSVDNGLITSAGLLSAPNWASGTINVTATSVKDTSKSNTVAVSITSAPGVSVVAPTGFWAGASSVCGQINLSWNNNQPANVTMPVTYAVVDNKTGRIVYSGPGISDPDGTNSFVLADTGQTTPAVASSGLASNSVHTYTVFVSNSTSAQKQSTTETYDVVVPNCATTGPILEVSPNPISVTVTQGTALQKYSSLTITNGDTNASDANLNWSVSDNASWLTVNRTQNGNIVAGWSTQGGEAPGSSSSPALDVQVDATNLTVSGSPYHAIITVTSSNAIGPTNALSPTPPPVIIQVPVTVTVTAAPPVVVPVVTLTGFWVGASPTSCSGQINLSWNNNQPANVTQPVTYTVTDTTTGRIVYSGSGADMWNTSANSYELSDTGQTSPATSGSGLVAGSSHTYTVTVSNASSGGPTKTTAPLSASAPSCSVTSPILEVSPSSYTYTIQQGNSVSVSIPQLTITNGDTNTSDGNLDWSVTSATTNGGSWLTAQRLMYGWLFVSGWSNAGGEAPTKSSSPALDVTINTNGMTAGNTYHGTIIVTSDNGTPSSITVPVTIVVTNQAVVAPSTPTGFWAGPSVCGTGQINLSWNASAGAISYTVMDGARTVYAGPALAVSDYNLSANSSHTYTITASNNGGTSAPAGATSPAITTAPNVCVSGSISISGFQADDPGTLIPVVQPIGSPASYDLNWTTTGSPDQCYTDGGQWGSNQPVSYQSFATHQSNVLDGTYTYNLRCKKTGVADATASVTVVVGDGCSGSCNNAPHVTLDANPKTGFAPLNSTLTWTVTGNNVTNCFATGGDYNWNGSLRSVNGGTYQIMSLMVPTTFSLLCRNSDAQESSDFVTVTPTSGSGNGNNGSCSGTNVITVTKPSGGTVTSIPSGIDCGTTGNACSASFSTCSSVILNDQPDSLQKFTGWTGDCSGTGTCPLNMNTGHSVSGTFVPLPLIYQEF